MINDSLNVLELGPKHVDSQVLDEYGVHVIRVDEAYDILLDSPIDEFGCDFSSAFKVKSLKSPDADMYVEVCTTYYPARQNLYSKLCHVNVSLHAHVYDAYIIYWPTLDRHVPIYIMSLPLGGPLMSSLSSKNGFSEQDLGEKLLLPCMRFLEHLSSYDLSFRSLRVDRLYWKDDSQKEIVLLGSFAASNGINQGVLYETISRMNAYPHGRGLGIIADDFYALGIVCTQLILGYNPYKKFSDKEICDLKLTKGSIDGLMGNIKFPGIFSHLLNGLLCDDMIDRWSFYEVRSWVKSAHYDGKKSGENYVVNKGLIFFNGQRHYNVYSLCQNMHEHWLQSLDFLKTKTLQKWIRSSFRDNYVQRHFNILSYVNESLNVDDKSNKDVYISLALSILDPNGPVRFVNFSCMLDGFGFMLSHLVIENKNTDVWKNVIINDLPKSWMQIISLPYTQKQFDLNLFKTQKYYFEKEQLGTGLERCLYELNPYQPCLSPLVRKDYILSLSDLLKSLNKRENSSNSKNFPIDAHIVAFICARFPKNKSYFRRDLFYLSHERKSFEYAYGAFSLITSIEHPEGESYIPLCQWLAESFSDALEVFYCNKRSDDMKEKLKELAEKGSIVEMRSFLLLIDAELEKDSKEFVKATGEYVQAENLIIELDENQTKRQNHLTIQGYGFAEIFCGMIAFIVLISFLVDYYFR